MKSLKLLLSVTLICVVSANLPLNGRFKRFLWKVSSKPEPRNVPLTTEPSNVTPPTDLAASVHRLHVPTLGSVYQTVKSSPKLQDFLLNVSDKLLSCGLILLALRAFSRAVSTSWNELQTQFGESRGMTSKISTNSSAQAYISPNTTLNTYEEEMLNNLVTPDRIDSAMDDIAGIDGIKDAICDMLRPQQVAQQTTGEDGFASLLTAPTRSVLLYGPPGCGKSMLARALCRHLKLPMITVTPSLLLRMYVGETSRLTKALFTLAQKLQPCLLFIDEADSLFCARTAADHSVDRKVVTEFMQLWDELLRERSEVVVIGATNRPQDLDPAIQRRFERSLLVPSPDLTARRQIFARILRGVSLEADFDAFRCAQATEGYSSSDLTQVCKTALRRVLQDRPPGAGHRDVRPLTTEDVLEALKTVVPTAWTSSDYARQGDGSAVNDEGTGGTTAAHVDRARIPYAYPRPHPADSGFSSGAYIDQSQGYGQSYVGYPEGYEANGPQGGDLDGWGRGYGSNNEEYPAAGALDEDLDDEED